MIGIGVTADEPKHLLGNGAEEDSLSGQEREDIVLERKSELGGGEDGQSTSAGTVGAGLAGIDDGADQVQILVLLVDGTLAVVGKVMVGGGGLCGVAGHAIGSNDDVSILRILVHCRGLRVEKKRRSEEAKNEETKKQRSDAMDRIMNAFRFFRFFRFCRFLTTQKGP